MRKWRTRGERGQRGCPGPMRGGCHLSPSQQYQSTGWLVGL